MAWRSGVLKVPQVVLKCRKVWEPLRWEVQYCNLKIGREGIGSKIFIWGREYLLIFFLPYFLWLTKAWMKPESQNYVLEARITPRVLGRNHVRFSDLDVCSGGSTLRLIKHLRWLMQVNVQIKVWEICRCCFLYWLTKPKPNSRNLLGTQNCICGKGWWMEKCQIFWNIKGHHIFFSFFLELHRN